MSREKPLDIDIAFTNFNFENPLLKNLRACKKIAPRDGKSVKIGRHTFSSGYPRIVKSGFKTPSNWEEIIRVEDGQELAPGQYHICTRRLQDNNTVDGFYVRTEQKLR